MRSPRSPYRWVVLLVAAVLVTDGCSTSSPRFGHRGSAASTPPARSNEPRFASKEAEEESRENDKKIEPKEIEGVVSGTRSFKTERNRAITPLDQSKMMREISKYMGVPYLHGGESTKGMDCSGYTMVVYKNAVGTPLPRSSAGQANVGKPVRFQDLKFGDLVFFNTTGAHASHVGIYLGDDLFAHASVTLGVTISSLESSYYKKRYESAQRVIGE
jgi:cell wall-associated NlpC family hydrolase